MVKRRVQRLSFAMWRGLGDKKEQLGMGNQRKWCPGIQERTVLRERGCDQLYQMLPTIKSDDCQILQ